MCVCVNTEDRFDSSGKEKKKKLRKLIACLAPLHTFNFKQLVHVRFSVYFHIIYEYTAHSSFFILFTRSIRNAKKKKLNK